ncbi:MAG: glutaminase A [Planctomycetes bacterium]|nr:glutaminase A [Planctomycetota bacterium]
MAATDDAAALSRALEAARAATEGLRDGAVADYIPRLAVVDPEQYGLAACTVDGVIAEVGDSTASFSLQSTSKAFAYALALQRLGREAVCAHIGVEPTGRSFDSVVRLETGTHRPHNPMINAGAIAVAGMLAADVDVPVATMLATLGDFAAADLQVDAATYLSERETGDQNRAIAYLLRYHGVIDVDVTAALDLYFQQCSVMASCHELAVMAATLAHGGRNPVTGKQVVAPEVARDVIAVMSTCGLYDGAGAFLYEVGLPAKSGVSGAIFAVVPGRMGIAAWSPRLDPRGNPVRGVAALQHLSQDLGLHVFSPREVGPAPRVLPSLPADDTLHELLEQIANEEQVDICFTELDGTVLHGGQQQRFSMQATANAFGHALALSRHGTAAVEALVGVEASGNPFHAIFLDGHRPHNPLGNAGAITIASTVPGEGLAERVDVQLRDLARLAGVPRLEVDAVVLEAERRGGDRNRAIASLLRAHGVVLETDAALEIYFHQCAIRIGTEELARMASVLASGGLDPVTGERLLEGFVVRAALSVMYTCGLHDESGRFAFDVGLPAKSGISGAIVAVAPGRGGIAVYAPGVNEHGTSEAGRRALVKLAERLRLSVFLAPPGAGRA